MSPTGTLEIDVEVFAGQQPDAYLIDVREPGEYVTGHAPGAVLLPLGQLGERVGELPTDRTVFVICASGNRSLRAAQALAQAGYDAVSVAGGTGAWIRSGRPVVTGSDPS